MQLVTGNLLHCLPTSPVQLEYSPQTTLLIDDHGRIQAKGGLAALQKLHPKAPVIDYQDRLLIPGFLDTHIHFPQMDMIGSMAHSLLPWLEKYTFPTEIGYRGRSDLMLRAAHLFVDELLSNGTTLACVYSSSNHDVTDLLFEVFAQRGLRGIIGKTSMNRHAPDALLVPLADDIAQQKALLQRWHGFDQRLALALTPRFAPSCTPDLMQALGELHAQYPDTYIQTHYAENLGELLWIQELFPQARDYLDVYESFALIGSRTILAHGIHVEADAIRRLAQHKTMISHCPTSNLFLGSGLFAWKKMEEHGVPISLGTDVGAGTSFSLWQTMNEAYKVAALRGEIIQPVDLLAAATLQAAQGLGLSDLGSLEEGYQADFQVIDVRARPLLDRRIKISNSPAEILAALIHLADDRCVESVWVNGKELRST
ncbi:MAG TPA: guanine deaminase [Oligoflexus sp.]|uniref:guanine deaminase n=1 Tax=Oligoflexus sp. TaxID=1971216 RepID=UPI002D5ADFF7|nr:guanine deaminase [Oligoflexus sp.]HYX34810.1 guanine deaminase [Oligoflexus sp.]